MQKKKRKTSVKKRIAVILLCVFFFACSLLGITALGSVYTGRTFKRFTPDYEKMDLTPILAKSVLSESDYETLYRQTGLTKLGIDGLLKENKGSRIFEIQDFFFEEHAIKPHHFAPFTYLERIDGYAPMAVLEDGDIIVSSTTRVSWFRYGHTALVLDGETERLLESFAPGQNSAVTSSQAFARLANFLILRPKANKAVKEQVVNYAWEHLIGVPYRMTTGVFSKKFPAEISGSQCAHIVWYAYKKYGIDLDSTGGAVVKPQDMALSSEVELVQAFGFDLDTLWG